MLGLLGVFEVIVRAHYHLEQISITSAGEERRKPGANQKENWPSPPRCGRIATVAASYEGPAFRNHLFLCPAGSSEFAAGEMKHSFLHSATNEAASRFSAFIMCRTTTFRISSPYPRILLARCGCESDAQQTARAVLSGEEKQTLRTPLLLKATRVAIAVILIPINAAIKRMLVCWPQSVIPPPVH